MEKTLHPIISHMHCTVVTRKTPQIIQFTYLAAAQIHIYQYKAVNSSFTTLLLTDGIRKISLILSNSKSIIETGMLQLPSIF